MMIECSLVKNKDEICGMWIDDLEAAKDTNMVLKLFMKECSRKKRVASEDFQTTIKKGSYRVVINTFDMKGGCFIMFSEMPAPGEPKKLKKTPLFYIKNTWYKVRDLLGL